MLLNRRIFEIQNTTRWILYTRIRFEKSILMCNQFSFFSHENYIKKIRQFFFSKIFSHNIFLIFFAGEILSRERLPPNTDLKKSAKSFSMLLMLTRDAIHQRIHNRSVLNVFEMLFVMMSPAEIGDLQRHSHESQVYKRQN